MGAAAGLGLLALGALTAFFILALDGFMPNWAAALIVAVVYAIIAGVLFSIGRKALKTAWPPVSERTTDAFKQGVGGALTRGRDSVKVAWPPLSPETVQAVRDDAATIVARGRQGMREVGPLVPEQTVETLKEDVEWAKTQT